MKRRWARWGFAFGVLIGIGCVGVAIADGPASGSATTTAEDEAAGKAWWAHIEVLASDSMRGRLTGTPDYLRAAAYVVRQFKAYGLTAAGVGGSYYQPVHFVEQWVDAEKSSLGLVVDGQGQPLALGQDAVLSSRSPQPQAVDADLVFIGYGLHLPESGYDDFNSAEVPASSLRGKIVVVINGGPADLPGALKSYARTTPMRRAIREVGVVGIVSIPTPKSMDFGWERIASSASQAGMWLAPEPGDAAVARRHPALEDDHDPMFAAVFNPAQAEKLFAGTGHTFAEMLTLADAQKPLPRFDLKKKMTATVVTQRDAVVSPNLVAKLEGTDPGAGYVAVSAHLDHLGVGAPIKGKTIYNGAMDDASGVATVLETAQALSEDAARGIRPRRSVLFVIFTAEEKGLLGSRYFAGHPTVPEGSIKADLNLDMFMPLFAFKKLHVQGLEQSTLQNDARKVGAAHGVVIAGDPEPDRNSFIRTDQYSFVQAGVPALAMKFGWQPGSPEYHMWREWLRDRYHSPQDDLSQPVDLVAAAQFNAFFADLVRAVANDPATPHYLETSFFHRFEAQ
ncbi:MAG TPA: M20/M25/M40 family metallo-hydrolase [Acidobacteriaceae bacterium]|nr:M20/M25/M40 family metallo-hydrolase [Acidobacteriaceae bacterium]